jgi:hypothetical protein
MSIFASSIRSANPSCAEVGVLHRLLQRLVDRIAPEPRDARSAASPPVRAGHGTQRRATGGASPAPGRRLDGEELGLAEPRIGRVEPLATALEQLVARIDLDVGQPALADAIDVQLLRRVACLVPSTSAPPRTGERGSGRAGSLGHSCSRFSSASSASMSFFSACQSRPARVMSKGGMSTIFRPSHVPRYQASACCGVTGMKAYRCASADRWSSPCPTARWSDGRRC